MTEVLLRRSRLEASLPFVLFVMTGWSIGCVGEGLPETPRRLVAEGDSSDQPDALQHSDEASQSDTTGITSERASEPLADSADEVDARWGHVSGRFVYDGDPPVLEKLELTKDIEFCSQNHPVDQSLVVDADSGGLANVVVWLDVRRAEEIPEMHELSAGIGDPIVINNKACVFEPHVAFLRTGQKLRITNDDTVDHNTQAFLDRNTPFNVVIPHSDAVEKQFGRPERQPVKLSCSIHRWMDAWLIVKDHPYVAISGEDGHFRIENLPVGEWTFRVWHELPEFVEQVSRESETLDLPDGKLTLTIESGDNDLGELRLAAELFAD